jgi:hypothetical protein
MVFFFADHARSTPYKAVLHHNRDYNMGALRTLAEMDPQRERL